MKKLDVLLELARQKAAGIKYGAYMLDDGNFIMALGQDLEQYSVTLPDGRMGYDAMKALNDTAADDWRDYSYPGYDIGIDDHMEISELPFNPFDQNAGALSVEAALTALHCCTRAETEEMLKDEPVIIDGGPRFISYDELKAIADERKPEQKPQKLFGWG